MELEYSENVRLAHETLLNVKKSILMLQEWNEEIKSPDEWLTSSLGMQRLAGNAMMVEVIGEEVKKVEKRLGMEFLNQRPEIPWRDIMGMRNHIAHGYFDIDGDVIFSSVKDDLDALDDATDFLLEAMK